MRLKHHRELAGLSQRKFAEIMEVSQPTVTRWENGQAEMSGQRLQRAAEVLHCTPDDLLGVRKVVQNYIEPPEDWDQDAACWGTLSFTVKDEVFDYPISFAQRTKLINAASEYDQVSSWIEVLTLNNTILALNLDLVDGVELIADDVEEAPFHMSAASYEALQNTPMDVAEHLAAEINEFRERHTPEQEDLITSKIRVHYASGKKLQRHLDVTSINAAAMLLLDLGNPRFFELPEASGYMSSILSLNRTALIEVPMAKFQERTGEVEYD